MQNEKKDIVRRKKYESNSKKRHSTIMDSLKFSPKLIQFIILKMSKVKKTRLKYLSNKRNNFFN